MSTSDSTNNENTASAHTRGGCFSRILSPLYILLIILAVWMLASGETTQPWELSGRAPMETMLEDTNLPSEISPLFTAEVRYWQTSITRWAAEWNLDPNLVATVMQIESCGDPNALSPAGAIGLFQVMPYHFSEGDNPYAPETNARRGLAYLRQAVDTYQDIRLSLASYNGGISTASKAEHTWPGETIRYVHWGGQIYQDAESGLDSSPRLQEWLASGGAGLCAQAQKRLGLTP